MFDCALERGLPGKEGETMNGQHTAEAKKGLENVETCAVKGGADEDRLLVADAKSGDAGAFGELYERHRSKTYRVAFRILRNDHDAEDAVQKSFERAFVNLSRFREDSGFSTWVTRIGAAMLAAVLAGGSPAGATCPVATVVISGGGKGDRPVESPEVKALGGWEKDPVRSAKGANNSTGRSECSGR